MKRRCFESPTPTNGTLAGGRQHRISSHDRCESCDPAILPSCNFMSAEWESWPDEKLLDVSLCDLVLAIEGTEIEQRIAQLNGELAARSLVRPHYWLSDEWFTPDGVPGIAIPFYLAHPRLAKLELAQMLEVEGGDPDSCLRILRHE